MLIHFDSMHVYRPVMRQWGILRSETNAAPRAVWIQTLLVRNLFCPFRIETLVCTIVFQLYKAYVRYCSTSVISLLLLFVLLLLLLSCSL
jgi:hypothetical protein